jgi:hypothetical protein
MYWGLMVGSCGDGVAGECGEFDGGVGEVGR